MAKISEATARRVFYLRKAARIVLEGKITGDLHGELFDRASEELSAEAGLCYSDLVAVFTIALDNRRTSDDVVAALRCLGAIAEGVEDGLAED